MSGSRVTGVLECLTCRYNFGSAILLMANRAHLIRYQAPSMSFLRNVPVPSTEDAEMQEQQRNSSKEVAQNVLDLIVFEFIFISNSSPKSTTIQQENGQKFKDKRLIPSATQFLERQHPASCPSSSKPLVFWGTRNTTALCTLETAWNESRQTAPSSLC